MSERPFMKFYFGDYHRDTRHLTTLQHGAYFLLIGHYWSTGSLPKSDAMLARIAGLSIEEWMGIKPVIKAFFSTGWKHKRIDEEIAAFDSKHEVRKAAGKSGGKMKSLNAKANRASNATNLLEQKASIPEPESELDKPPPSPLGETGAKSDAMALRMEIAKAYNDAKKLPPDTGRVEVWLEQGYSLAMIRAVVLGGVASKQPRTLAYFDQPLADAAAVKAPEPPPAHVIADDTWRKVVKRYLEFGKWPTKDDDSKGIFGAEPGCRGMKCPIHILSEFGIEVQKTQPG